VFGSGAISKGEFARRRNVSAARVSQWIAQGKIHGPAIVGEGRRARIDERVACAQLDRALDTGQRLANGLHTNLKPAEGAAEGPRETASVADQIQLLKLRQLERTEREAGLAAAIRASRLTDADAAQQAMGRKVAELLDRIESAMISAASAAAAQFRVPQRDMLHLLRAEVRKIRMIEAERSRAAAEAWPETMQVDVPEPDQAHGPEGAAPC
jgi:hypothetical protein